MFKKTVLLGFSILLSTVAFAEIKTQTVPYTKDGTKMEGYLAYDDQNNSSKPLVIIVHDWMGLSDYQKEKAQQLAKEGYVAFAADIYGVDERPTDEEQAEKLIEKYFGNRSLLRNHVRAAYDQAITFPQVDAKKVVVMGYCFGGTTALELARTGAPLVGTVSFHGILDNPTPQDSKNIKGKVLILNGENDPHVPAAKLKAFKSEMDKAGVQYEIINFPGAVHAFTNPNAGSDKSKGVAYDPAADKKSWQDFMDFLKKVTK